MDLLLVVKSWVLPWYSSLFICPAGQASPPSALLFVCPAEWRRTPPQGRRPATWPPALPTTAPSNWADPSPCARHPLCPSPPLELWTIVSCPPPRQRGQQGESPCLPWSDWIGWPEGKGQSKGAAQTGDPWIRTVAGLQQGSRAERRGTWWPAPAPWGPRATTRQRQEGRGQEGGGGPAGRGRASTSSETAGTTAMARAIASTPRGRPTDSFLPRTRPAPTSGQPAWWAGPPPPPRTPPTCAKTPTTPAPPPRDRAAQWSVRHSACVPSRWWAQPMDWCREGRVTKVLWRGQSLCRHTCSTNPLLAVEGRAEMWTWRAAPALCRHHDTAGRWCHTRHRMVSRMTEMLCCVCPWTDRSVGVQLHSVQHQGQWVHLGELAPPALLLYPTGTLGLVVHRHRATAPGVQALEVWPIMVQQQLVDHPFSATPALAAFMERAVFRGQCDQTRDLAVFKVLLGRTRQGHSLALRTAEASPRVRSMVPSSMAVMRRTPATPTPRPIAPRVLWAGPITTGTSPAHWALSKDWTQGPTLLGRSIRTMGLRRTGVAWTTTTGPWWTSIPTAATSPPPPWRGSRHKPK